MSELVFATHPTRPIAAEAVRHLYDLMGWWPQRSLADIAFVLEQQPAVGAWDGERMIGFARAVTDGRLRAYLEDVMVHPAYRRRGVGQRLLQYLLAELAPIETISLFCEPDLALLYEQLGFRLRESQRVLHRKGELYCATDAS